ncbi:unnamed protein product [Protopolystoma xenopodis]|uniref:Band 7 domain-containing protein n=1 Tax=Protopolystoma xenopodis TaxID=117903 RepID=A0A3S5A656_9PLAT|nr:unnamed protein product [Protopolystoma xenopodis]
MTIMAPGLYIQAVRVTKPKIPEQIRRNYEAIEAEKTKLLIAMQKQKVIEMEAETERRRARIEAEKQAEVEQIEWRARIEAQRNQLSVSSLEDEAKVARARAEADSELYHAQKQAEADQARLTPQYLELAKFQAMSANAKIYFTSGGADVAGGFGGVMNGPLLFDLLASQLSSLKAQMHNLTQTFS